MIRVKAIRVKEVFAKFLLSLTIMILLYFLFLLVLHRISTFPKNFAMSIVEEMLPIQEQKTGNQLQIALIQNELYFLSPVEKKELPVYVAEETSPIPPAMDAIPSQEEKQAEGVNPSFLSTEKISPQTRPARYEVEEMASGKIRVGKAYIDNYSTMRLDLQALSQVSDYPINDDTNILIFHTHTSEAYSEIGTKENFRTTNDAYNVVAVGEALKENLLLQKFHVLHDITKHDTPSYNGAYNSSLNTVEKLVAKQPYDIIIDLHRDAVSR